MSVLKKSVSKKSTPLDLLLKNFAGERVEIVVNRDLETPIATSDGETIEIINIPLTIAGFITDQDDNFIYLGLSVNQIDQAVNKEFVVHIMIADEIETVTDVNGRMPVGSFN